MALSVCSGSCQYSFITTEPFTTISPTSLGPTSWPDVSTNRTSAWKTGRPTVPTFSSSSCSEAQSRMEVSVWPMTCRTGKPAPST